MISIVGQKKSSKVYDDKEAHLKTKECEKVSSLFRLLLILMKVSGTLCILSKESKWKRKDILHLCYCVTIQLVSFLNALRYIFAFISDNNIYRYHIGIFTFVWLFFTFLYISMACLLSSKHFTKFLKAFDEYQSVYGIHFKMGKYGKIVKLVTVLCVLEIILANVFIILSFIFGWISTKSLYGFNLWPFHTSSGTTLIVTSVVYGIVITFPVSSCILLCLFYFFTLSLIRKEFEHVFVRLVNLRDQDVIDVESELEDIRQQHQAIVNLLSSANPVLSHAAGGFYAMGIPLMCMMLYGIASGTLLWDDVFKMIATIIGNLIGMFAITFKGAAVNSKAHKSLDVLHNLDLSALSEKTVSQILIFASRLNRPPIGVSVYGLFTVDYPAVLMIFGTIITYAVIAIQFTSTGEDCPGLSSNGTNATLMN